MQLLLYAPGSSSRLSYTCQFIFKELMNVEFEITTDLESFTQYKGAKIAYSKQAIEGEHFWIAGCGLLFETDIKEQEIHCFEVNDYKVFFKTEAGDFSFDILAASFYLLSRYEEYLPHRKDMYGRYAHENSLAYRENFLHLPLLNIWVLHFGQFLKSRFPGLTISGTAFKFIPTYDIDIAFSYKHKGVLRNAGSFLKSPSLQRIKVLAGAEKDPYDAYDWLNQLHADYHFVEPVYFFLMAAKNGQYDKNILSSKKAMKDLIKQHAAKYKIGIHPSWQSGDHSELLRSEKKQLELISNQPISLSRQHYIRLSLPDSYRILIQNGITDDFSMGYGSINGFRASVAASFNWFDLQKNEPTLLRIHPFSFMEANSFYEQKMTPAAALEELKWYYSVCKETDGLLITIWHNNFLGTDPQYAGWRETYLAFFSQFV